MWYSSRSPLDVVRVAMPVNPISVSAISAQSHIRTNIAWSQVVYGPWPSIEDEDDMQAHAITIKPQAFLGVFDPQHQMIQTKLCRCWR
jgi:hypothetical protein